MKKKIMVFASVVIALVLVGALVLTIFIPKAPAKGTEKTDNTSSSASESEVIIDDVDEPKSSNNESADDKKFIEPNESEADRIIKEHIENKENKKKKETKTESKTSSKTNKTSSVKTQTREEGEKKLNNTASKYLKEHNIDAATAGETGEICANCGKKIWDPDKYGFFIPGMPKDYENSNYCLGTCGVTFE
ncbi:MAG: hypothetical protein J6D52_02555 [Clostridia bacterium]|nr:hypothetical protein [Clostridia bacterium]